MVVLRPPLQISRILFCVLAGAIEQLMALHRRLLPSLGGYLTENGVVNVSRVAVLLTELGVVSFFLLSFDMFGHFHYFTYHLGLALVG